MLAQRIGAVFALYKYPFSHFTALGRLPSNSIFVPVPPLCLPENRGAK